MGIALRRPPQARHKPRQQLPVTAYPAVTALGVGAVACRVPFEQLHVAEQAGVGVAAFDQVMAEHPVIGKAAIQCALERVHCVDAFANERPAEEQVLIDVGNGLCVGVDTRIAGEQAGVGRACARG